MNNEKEQWGDAHCSFGTPDESISGPVSKSTPGEAGSIWEGKKNAADVQFSRLLQKPRKRNGTEFFWRGAGGGTRTQLRNSMPIENTTFSAFVSNFVSN